MVEVLLVEYLLPILFPVVEWAGANIELFALGAAGTPILGVLLYGLFSRISAPPPPQLEEPPAVAEPTVPAEVEEDPFVAAEPAVVAEVEVEPAPEEPAAAAEPAGVVEPEVELPPEELPEPELEPPAEVPVEPVAEPLEPVAEPVAPPVEPPPKPVRLRDRLARTSEALVGRLESILGGRKVDADLLDELEVLLFTADLGVQTAESLLGAVRKDATGNDALTVRELLREKILEKLRRVEPVGDEAGDALAKPYVILVLGVNGSGKTTTIGKLAAQYQQRGRSVILGAGDTFRAAAVEQLQTWGERVGCEVIAGRPDADPASVAFDTVRAAESGGIDVAIIDTAGRLQTKAPLMEELSKIVRVIGKGIEGAPHETLLVLDANTGQNAISQAHLFTEAAGVSGLVLTKLDGTAKGGVIIGLADEFGIPVRYVGVGEKVEDLRDFSADDFVDALFASEESEGGGSTG
jgi:fused signal recognition particle receptor